TTALSERRGAKWLPVELLLQTPACYGRGHGVGRGRGVGGGRTAGKTLTTPVIPAKQCMAQKYWYMPGCVKVNSYTNPVSLRIPASQFMLSGEQNCPSAVQDVPLVT